ncbi:hypothetical protein F7205_07255 [Helicobacter pylori]|uniref:hypothetical protein n=1 Tax=Helicobacter pylori TaxID=210 RepID=UPI0014184B83|nr:hypothetical protein [Helicobacter pylori]MUU53219.1 hypothetical protein [Helicobacter pylori]
MTPLIKNLNSSSLARILFYSIKSNQLLMEEILTLIFKFLLLEKRGLKQTTLGSEYQIQCYQNF